MTTLDSKTAPTIADHEAEQIDRANATGLTRIVVDASHSIALSQPTRLPS